MICASCNQDKEAHLHFDKVKKSKNKRGYSSYCFACQRKASKECLERNKEKYLAYQRQYNRFRDRTCGMSQLDYLSKLARQESKCKICGEFDSRLEIDHCHITKKFRGLLCGKCNKALGLFQESPEILEKALNYLRTYIQH